MKEVSQLLAFALCVGFIASTPLVKDDSSTTNSIRYFLYTHKDQVSSEELVNGDLSSIQRSNFDSRRPTKIIIHGWSKSAEETPNPQIRSAYLADGDYNIISVDWAEYAALNYVSSRYKVAEVGANVASFIDYLNEHAGLAFDLLVVIGHSLGAHCAGYTGKLVTRGRLPYIVGLDPALPLFSYDKPSERLNSKDAYYVETIQTNGGKKGFLQPIGSASFYPNWGRSQPGCGADVDGTCAHARSVLYYAEALRKYKFSPISTCSSYNNIRETTDCDGAISNTDIGDPTQIVRKNGIFFLKTSSEEPFGHK